ncbi:MAG: T9SS type A sorting domain-containing protein [Chitinophagaceae bacterium]|nr:T9SS type A sorting domain-containing protein [Chitinophagaceae bacterium]
MKKSFFVILFLYVCSCMHAQLYVQGGATLYIGGTVTLLDQDFIRSPLPGSAIVFEPASRVLFTGNTNSLISGYIDFLNLEIAKENNRQVSLTDYNEAVRGQLIFTSGLFNLDNNMLLLGNTGILINENENSRIIGPTGGAVQARQLLDQPAGVNPGNIGASITSSKNLGGITINRGYVFGAPSPINSIERYYTIVFDNPANDVNLDASLQLYYFDTELGSADETKLVHWKYLDASSTWQQQGPAGNITRNTTENWVQLTGIGSLSPWTLAEATAALPLQFTRFTVTCNNNTAVINWQTAIEINTHHFEVQRSINGTDWMTVATQPAAGQSSSLLNYTYTDPAPASPDKLFYRILCVDLDGSKNYTPTRTFTCGTGLSWQVWPNPVKQQAYVSLKLDEASNVSIQLLDSKGAAVRHWQKELLRGDNRLVIDMQDVSSGIYYLLFTWGEGKMQKGTKLIKQ